MNAGRPADAVRTVRVMAAAAALLAGLGCGAASLLTWMQISGGASISGWGSVTGGQDDADGQNINDILSGLTSSTYRPGVLPTIFGGMAVLAAVGLAMVVRGPKPHRIPAAVLALSGVVGLGWGVFRGIRPGDLAGLYTAEQVSSGAGPWLTAGCSVLLLAVAVMIFAGLLDPPEPLRRKGIQPR